MVEKWHLVKTTIRERPRLLESVRETLIASAFRLTNAGRFEAAILDLEKVPEILEFPELNLVDQYGLSLVHTAIARNSADLARYLIGRKVEFFPDQQGRLPSTLALVMGADTRLCQLVFEAEEKFLSSATGSAYGTIDTIILPEPDYEFVKKQIDFAMFKRTLPSSVRGGTEETSDLGITQEPDIGTGKYSTRDDG